MAGKRSHHFNLSAPRDTPLPLHLCAPRTPASAIADRIFNDPESWNAETRLGLSKEDIAAWDTIEQFPAVPSGPESADFTLKPFTNKFRLPVRPDLVSPESELESDSETYTWKGVKEKGEELPFITFNFERPGKDKVTEGDRMSVLWARGNLFRAFPSPASAPASPATDAPMGLFQCPMSPPHASPTSTPRSSLGPHFPALRRASKSATWSILEYYGAYLPETPRTAGDPTAPRASAQFLRVPSQPSVPPPPVPNLPPAPGTQKAKAALAAPKSAPATEPRISLASAPPTRQGGSSARARSGTVRPLPPIPRVPPVRPVEPPAWSPPRATASIRRLPPTPGPPPPPKDVPAHPRPLTIPQPAPFPNTRHQAALSLS
ncbi:hypothetical protein FB451DRAFT_1240116 [Mycena latifolia]|nr:hypothetical protein FB451DRAFT_1240116 [Mycena latifolia]